MEQNKLPVFFHIPKNAGTYTNNMCFSFMQRFAAGKKHYHVDVYKDGIIYYRFICYSEHPLNEKFEQLNHKCLYKINLKDLSFDGLFVFMLRIADSGFSDYKEDIYKKLDKNRKLCEFLVLRDPYERALSLFSYLKSSQSSHESTNGMFGDMTFVEYLNSPYLEGSWLIRRLLKIPNETPITKEHFDNTCQILDGFLISDIKNVDKLISKVFYMCFNIKDCNIDQQKIYSNKTKEKITHDFDSLSEKTRDNFNKQTKWDQLLFNKYKTNVHNLSLIHI